MEKIIVVVNAHKPDIVSIDFACRVAALSQSTLTGLFLETLYYHPPGQSVGEETYIQSAPLKDGHWPVTPDTDQAVKYFVEECSLHHIATEIYIDKGEPMQEVIYESRFADLLIVDPTINFYDSVEQSPSHFTKVILSKAECPVLLSPAKITDMEEIVFCYDGTTSSMYAFKQFSYLLPQYKYKKAILLEVNPTGNEEFLEDHRRIMNWLKAHYNNIDYESLKGKSKDELFSWFSTKANKIAVMGFYDRSVLSRIFKKSLTDSLIHSIDLPVFITHYNRQS